MNCNCNNKNNSMKEAKIKHVFGNVLRIAIPLTLRTVELVDVDVDGEIEQQAQVTDTDFIPSSDYPVNVVFNKGAVKVSLKAQMRDGNIAYVEDKGKISVGTYDITVTCNDNDGNPYRFKQNTILQVVDATADAGIATPIEYEVTTWYLDAAIYLVMKGEDGVGIEDIITESSGEIGGVNTITFVLTNGETRSFTILNGSGSVDSDFDENSLHPISNSVITNKFKSIDANIAGLFGDVDYDSSSKILRFWDITKSTILATVDARPFVKDGMVNRVYIQNRTLVITFNADSGHDTIAISLDSVFNPNNYYTRVQTDNRIADEISSASSGLMTKAEYVNEDSNNIKYSSAPEIVLSHIEGVSIMEESHSRLFGTSDGHIKGYAGATGSQLYDYGLAPDGLVFLDKTSGLFYRWDYTTWQQVGDSSGGYEPPIGGIPKTDLAQSVQDTLDDVSNKVDKVAGKGLSTEDYTTAEKQKLAGLSNYDDTEIQAEVDAKYEKPNTGIPKTDLASGVQASLGKADTALQSSDLEGYATTDDVDDAVAALVSSAPQTLDTLNELAEALGDDPNFATTMATQLGNKVDKETGKGLSTNDYTTAEKNKLAGLENYDDTAVKQRVSELESKKRVFVELTFDGQNRPWLEDQDDNMLTASEFMNIMNQPWLYDVQIYYQNRVYYYNLRISNSDSWEFWATENERKRYMIVERDDESSFGLNFEIHNDMINPSDINTTSVYQFVSQGEKDKLAGIASGAQVNVQSDWNATSGDAKILNKPDLSTFATKTELAGKQGVIDDLDAIRSGAGLGSTSVQPNDLSDVATSGSYNDLDDKPTIPAEQIQADWNQTSTTAKDYIKNKPTLANVATSGSYNDLQDKPNIPAGVTVDQTITQNGTNPVRGSAIYNALAEKTEIEHLSFEYDDVENTFTFYNNDGDTITDSEFRDICNSKYVFLHDEGNGVSLIPTEKSYNNWVFYGVIGGTDVVYVPLYWSSIQNRVDGDYSYTTLVPITRKVNNKPLSRDITLNASDIGALPASTTIPSKTSDLTNDSGFINKSMYYGTSTTAAATMPKVCTVETFPTTTSGNVTHAKEGTIIAVKFTNSDTNTTDAPELNVNGIGAKAIMYNNAIVTSTAKNTTVAGYAKQIAYYRYDPELDEGNGAWEYLGKSVDSNSTYSNASLGQGYATQSNSAAATAITASISSYVLSAGGFVTIKFTYDVPANATLNISSKGAKAIYNQGSPITAGVIKAGDTATFIYSTYYHLVSVDSWQENGKPFIANLIANYDENDDVSYTCDKTYAQLCEAIDAGRQVYLFEDEFYGRHLTLSNEYREDGTILFSSFTADTIIRASITDDNTVSFRSLLLADGNEVVYKINSVSYSSLVRYRNISNLTAGQWYRITDYTCTTTQTDTRSAGHQFDILVQATSPNTLSEEAKAIRHEGDTYFADANLEAWKIWYCLDNDTTRFTWADTTNGKGVIYRMIDEWNNDCPYDFKNIQFKRYKITATTKTDTWLVGKYMAATTYMAGHTIDANDFVWCYTFNGYYASWNQDDEYIDSYNLGSDAIDLSKFNYSSFYDENSGSQGCARNVIPYHIDSDSMSQPRISLNNIVMYGWVADVSTIPSDYEDLYGNLIFQMMSTPYSNTFGDSCNHITFGDGCNSNTFGDGCNYITFGSGCNGNTFGYGCNGNAFGNGCKSNTFGNGCYANTFGNNCYFNIFGNNFNSNKFGNYCQYSIFGNNCSSITFGNNGNYNKFGIGCQSNTFGNDCNSNTFGNSCYHNTFGDSCSYNTFVNYCTYNTFVNYCQSNTFGDGCNDITFSKSYTQYVIIENGNKKITLTSSQTTTGSRPLRNITIAQGVNNTDTTKTISHNTLNDTFRTTYVATNSVEVQV